VHVDAFLQRLANVKRSGKGWIAQCPGHEDAHPSLSITEGTDGRVLLHCHAGCRPEQIAEAVALTMADLFTAREEGGPQGFGIRLVHSNSQSHGLTVNAYAAAKQLPVEFLTALGLSDCHVPGPAVRIPYRTEGDQVGAVQFRSAMDGRDRFRWKNGSKPIPYGLWRLDEARAAGYVVLVEGASDAQTLWYHDIPALGIPGATTWRSEWETYLHGIATVYVVLEPDKGGEAVLKWIATCGFRERVRLLSCGPAKDPSGLYLQDPSLFPTAWAGVVETARLWTDLDRDRRAQEASDSAALAGPLLGDPALLDRIGLTMHAEGYAGDLQTPLLVYLALTSRALERPMNLAIVAPSGAGKNRALDAAVALMPPEAVHVLTAGSARALVYSEQNFTHRMVIYSEADSLPEDGPAAAAIRSIAADNRLIYEVAEKDARTGQFVTRRIEKGGPTGLITTSTRSLGEQMNTRVLEVSVRDDAEHTRQVMRAHAARVQRPSGPVLDHEPFLALQRWLSIAGVRKVVVPYAEWLADQLPAQHVRMRRDFRQLLTTIQTMAFLYQCQRGRTPSGAIEATIEDYARARDLLATVFDAVVTAGLTPVIRQTVEAVGADEEVSAAMLTTRLSVSKSTCSYRVTRAVQGGWLVNREVRKGHPARLAQGAPLPDAVSALPTVEALRQVFECSNPIPDNIPTTPPPVSDVVVPADAGWGNPLGDVP
jgi:hypothetical protein